MLWSGATAVMLSRCHTVTRPNTGHLAQDSAAHCKSLLTLIYNSALRAGVGRVLVGNISSVLTLHCVLWLLVCGGWCRRVLTGGFLAVSSSSCFLTPAGPDVFLPIPQQPGPYHTVTLHCHTVTLSHCHTVTTHCQTLMPRPGHQMELLPLLCACVTAVAGWAGLIWAGREAY